MNNVFYNNKLLTGVNQAAISLKEEASKIMEFQGNTRGEMLAANINYIEFREGKESVAYIERKLEELGFPVTIRKFKALKWYPESLSVLIVMVAREIFNWADQDIFDMGNAAPKSSLVVQLLMRHFFSSRKSFEAMPKYWRSNFDFGELEAFGFDEEKKSFVIRINGYKFHPIMCIYYAGYFLRIAQFIIKSPKIEIEEKKCAYGNGSYHEYEIKWQ
ncbi:MAG: hypothetical protein A3F15_01865 [Candidatus Wildermuthbacteria bacterium RIFCSPHIGHO2_12_FULL_40_12]|uniref:4-vinyl reductase 4VR domain-containing protein n=1 Tax=Candidatus Wildermuthbacteria bacterium RIFCSPHIGHO2_12_FULL_40_12 TaxID=1802457 RepID=A0A1G2RBY6_9BACT|nr:MAG: hypothetical protein A3F15_01865 [Candidatus Wildermuthbacteria bacterium RIFCSPHIGHO2_12_FULL_40_12]